MYTSIVGTAVLVLVQLSARDLRLLVLDLVHVLVGVRYCTSSIPELYM